MHQDPEHSAHIPDLTMAPLSCSLHSNPTLSSFQFLQPAPSSAPSPASNMLFLLPAALSLSSSGFWGMFLITPQWGVGTT